jgi:hypothetical protein
MICLRQRDHVTADAVRSVQTVEDPTCQRFVAVVPAGDTVDVWRPAADPDWPASVSSILAVCRCSGRFRQVKCRQTTGRVGPCRELLIELPVPVEVALPGKPKTTFRAPAICTAAPPKGQAVFGLDRPVICALKNQSDGT